MKESLASVQRGFYNAVMSLPEDVRFRITALSAYAALFGPGFGGRTPHAKRAIYNYIDNLRTEKRARLSDYIDIVDGWDRVVSGEENLPKGPYVIAINKPSYGIGRGFWMMFLVNNVVAEVRRSQGLGDEPTWLQHDGTMNFRLDGGVIEYHRRVISEKISRLSGTILIGKSGASGNLEAKERALAVLRSGGIVAVTPEGRPSKRLRQPSRGAGSLLELLGEEAPIVPAAGWAEDGNVLRLSFAEPIDSSLIKGEDRKKFLIDRVMGEIANLLPLDKK